MITRIAIVISFIVLLTAHLSYPKWQMSHTEATISYDVSGYYLYLPAIFIYKDLKKCDFLSDILSKYHPTSEPYQVIDHKASETKVMKYPAGQAIQFLPFFTVAHLWAGQDSRYVADGFSYPYQLMISIGSLLTALIGVIILCLLLRRYYSDWVTGATILSIVAGTNYLNYAAIDGAMTHNNLFTLYALLLYCTARFYDSPSRLKAIVIGLICGLMALTRPTEILSVVIPILWGCRIWLASDRASRWQFFSEYRTCLIFAVTACLAVGSIQLLYWRYVTGDFLFYSYGEQGFSWLRPHIMKGVFSYTTGWLVYSPILIFSLIGFISLRRIYPQLLSAALVFFSLYAYLVLAWDAWDYGGSLGNRAFIQSYAVLALPMAALYHWLSSRGTGLKASVLLLALTLTSYNIWLTQQSHNNGVIVAGRMTGPYFWKTLFTFEKVPEYSKLLDSAKNIFIGERNNVTVVGSLPDTIHLSAEVQSSPTLHIPLSSGSKKYKWLRVLVDCYTEDREDDLWKMAQLIIEPMKDGKSKSKEILRLQKYFGAGEWTAVYLDLKQGSRKYNEIRVNVWNASSQKPISITNLRVEGYDEP